MLQLSVKGNPDEALREAAFHGVNFATVLRQHERFNETTLLVPQHTLSRVMSWYCDAAVITPGTGYPVGTLLFYSNAPNHE